MKTGLQTILMTAVMAALVSCSEKENVTTVDRHDNIRAMVTITGDIRTKVTGATASEEENVSNLQLFVFDDKGTKEHYLNAGNSTSGEILSKEGKKTIVAIVNGPAMETVGSLSQLMGMTSLLSDNRLGGMVMTGKVEAIVQNGGRITIPVTRIISKVMLRRISSSFKSSSLSSKTFKVNSIYLINVAGDCNYGGTSLPGIWYNKLYEGRNDNACGSCPLLSDPVNAIVADKGSYTKEHSFYCYPNLVEEESFESTWSPRHTMLVIDAQLGGEQTYYPIELPVIGRNKCIIIEDLVITRKGSDYPYVPVSSDSFTASIEVAPWDIIFQRTETI